MMNVAQLLHYAECRERAGKLQEAELIRRIASARSTRTAGKKDGCLSPYDDQKLVYRITFPTHIIEKVIVSGQQYGSPDIPITCAFNLNGDYVGDPVTMKRLVERGIVPELSDSSHSVCSIGFNKDEQKWYGWSHRAIKGFGIGDTPEEWWADHDVTRSRIKTLEEAKKAAQAFAESVS